MLKNVAVMVLDGVAPFELGVLCEVFGTDRSAQGLPRYDFAVCSPGVRPVRTSVGFELAPTHDLDRLDSADLVGIPAMGIDVVVPPEVVVALQRAMDRGAWIVTVCSGIFVLQAAGLLEGRRCTTHWMHVDQLAAACPSAAVDPDVLYVQDGRLVTSAGSAAGIDACLHILRAEHGTRIANAVARRMVIPPHRDGGQRQYVETPVLDSDADTLAPLLVWMVEHLHEPLTVEQLASRCHTVAAHVRPAVPCRDGHDAALVADLAAAKSRRTAARGRRRPGRARRRACRVRHSGGVAPPFPAAPAYDAAGLPPRVSPYRRRGLIGDQARGVPHAAVLRIGSEDGCGLHDQVLSTAEQLLVPCSFETPTSFTRMA